MKILLVEDDAALGREIARGLRRENFVVDLAGDGEDGLHLGSTGLYDAAVLDLGLPKMSGIAVLSTWRAAGVKLPVMILTARDAWSDKVEGFKAGADDFLTKPFRTEELVMRLRALIRRAAGYADTIVRCGALSFNTHIGVFEFDGLPLRLTALEWRVLSCLALRKDVVVARTDLFEHVYAGDGESDSNSLEVIVARLRRKIGRELIETVRGRGYRLVCDGTGATTLTIAHRFRAFGPTSLTGRLLIGSAVATLVALALVLILMQQVLSRFVTGQIDQRLDNKIVALASQTRVAPEGTISLEGEADGPPFDKSQQHSFWLVQGPHNVLMTGWLSPGAFAFPQRAEIDEVLARPAPPAPGPGGLPSHPHSLKGDGLGVALHERIARTSIRGIDVTILVAAPNAAINGPVREAMATVGLGVLALGLALGALAFVQVRLGLRPLAELGGQVAEVSDGRRDLLPTDQPLEVAALVSEMNHLLERNAANLEKARRHVANLAHGLKTPLATLQLGVERLDGPGKDELHALLMQIDLRMRHHLGRARAGALAGPERSRTLLAPRLTDLGDALRHIHADRGVMLTLHCPEDLVLACEGNDVDEIFGNLLDNAFKFARSRVICSARKNGRWASIEIADDGPGLNKEQVALVLQPGRRLDERIPGFGFGLTIAQELVELYGGKMQLKTQMSGLVAAVALPLSVSLISVPMRAATSSL